MTGQALGVAPEGPAEGHQQCRLRPGRAGPRGRQPRRAGLALAPGGGLPGGDAPQAQAQQAGDRSAVWGVAYSPDGLHLAEAEPTAGWRFGAAPSRRPLPGESGGTPRGGACPGIQSAPPLLAFGNDDGAVEVFDQARGALVATGLEPLSGACGSWRSARTGGPWPPWGAEQTTASPCGTSSGKSLAGELRAPDDARLWRIALSPDGRTLAAGGCGRSEDEACTQGAIHLWDLARKERLGQALVGHTDWVTGLAFSADLRLLASGSDDSTVRLWDVADPARATERGAPLTDHGETVVIRSLAFSPAGRTLASGDRNGTIILWDASGRRPRVVGQLTDHGGAILSLAFSPDGRTLVSGSHDRTIRLWDVASRRPLGPRLACSPGRGTERGLPPGREGAGVGGEGRADLPLERGPALLADDGLRGRRPGPPPRRAGEPSGRRRGPPRRPAFEETCAQDALRRADAAALADEPERARAAFREAVAVAARTGDAWINNEVCWYGSIDGFAGAVLPACERAVQRAVGETEWQVRDSRGIALAITGQLARAQEDFEQYATWAEDNELAPLLVKRRRWIEQLKARQSPFADPAELRALRSENAQLMDR